MDFESIIEEILLGRGQGNLNSSRNRKKRYRGLFSNGRDCLIVGATAESLNKRVLFSSHNLVKSVVNKTVN